MSIFRVIRSVQWNPVPRHLRQLGPAGLSVAQLVEHVTVDICDHRVAGSIPAAEKLCHSSAGRTFKTCQRLESNQRPCDRRYLQSHALPIELRMCNSAAEAGEENPELLQCFAIWVPGSIPLLFFIGQLLSSEQL